jgi:hypothetical protein
MKTPFTGLRSPREKMAGWVHLPRFVDKIRLNAKNQLPPDYHRNFCKGFDGYWLQASGVDQTQFIEMVNKSENDAQVETWVKQNIKKSEKEIQTFNELVLNRGRDDQTKDIFNQRKADAGLNNRKDIQTFVDLIEADEGRL